MNAENKQMIRLIKSLEYENEILFGKSNSMGHSVHNYSRRIEELSK